ncbi:MAG: response regulator transcription factor [Phormidesmis sp.]
MLKLLIVEDQRLIREGLVALLSLEDDLTVVGEAENGQAALDLLATLPSDRLPEVTLLDMRMPVMDGVSTAKVLGDRYPQIKILVLTTFDEDALVAQAMAVGARGYLLKDTPSEELAMAVRSVAKGYSHFGPGIVDKMISGLPPVPLVPAATPAAGEVAKEAVLADLEALTPREREVLAWIGQGASNKEIAQQLYLSEGTVKNYVTSILSRLGLRDRTQAALFAQKSILTDGFVA